LKLKAFCKDIEMHSTPPAGWIPSKPWPHLAMICREEGIRMSGLKMMWLELNGQLVCRWVDESETTETVLRRLKDDRGASSGATGANQPPLTVGKAA
jgi:hypothetical protein